MHVAKHSDARGWYPWNIVKLDGKYYQVDASMFAGVHLKSTFLVSDAVMQKYGNREWDRTQCPACPENYIK